MFKNIAVSPKAHELTKDTWTFNNFRAEAGAIAAFAKARSRHVYYGGYGFGKSVSFFLPRATRRCIKKVSEELGFSRKKTIGLFALEVEIALKENHGHKDPEVACTKRRMKVIL
ncbi:hypothetical protein A3F64_02200 [Candidatus Saccharibacteria bacterium RIFCSPHIGHO2_12_FULL_42_8]|nr:MAG: hypothetical protein A3F64_02200 [Candidatus Saccharibacteria bacterium RIFCSPHIGHO2_12_FULL_42_8]